MGQAEKIRTNPNKESKTKLSLSDMACRCVSLEPDYNTLSLGAYEPRSLGAYEPASLHYGHTLSLSHIDDLVSFQPVSLSFALT